MPIPLSVALVLFSSLPAAAGTAKVTICHVDETGTHFPITVSERAVGAHLAHGDWIVAAEDHDDGLDNDCDGGIDEFHSLEGSIAYTTAFDDEVTCEALIDLVGTPYNGECSDCTFAFDIDATLVEPEDTTGCRMLIYWSFLFEELPFFTDTRLYFWDTYFTYWGSSYDNVLAAGYSYDLTAYGYGIYGPYTYLLAWDGHWLGNTATYSDGYLQWSVGPKYMSDWEHPGSFWVNSATGSALIE